MTTGTIVILVLIALNMGFHLAKDGEPKDGDYSFGMSVLNAVIWLLLLWWAGNFG